MVTHWYKRAHVTVAGVSTLAPGSDATVVVDENNAMTFGIPQGATGDTGATPAFTIGEVTTVAAGGSAGASITGTAAAPILNLAIPRGDKGDTGSNLNVNATTVPMSGSDATTVAAKLAAMEAAALTVTRHSATLYASNWQQAQEGDPYTQTVAPSGFVYSAAVKDTAVDIDMSEATVSTAAALLAAWSAIGRLYVDANGLNAVCYGDPPETDVKVVLSAWKSAS